MDHQEKNRTDTALVRNLLMRGGWEVPDKTTHFKNQEKQAHAAKASKGTRTGYYKLLGSLFELSWTIN